MNLVISLATRGRPEQLVDTIRRSVANWQSPETMMQVQLDEDDHPSIEALTKARIHERVVPNVQPREDTIADKWNRVLRSEYRADVYMSAADDDPYVVPGYDVKILEAAKRFPDGIGTVYGHMANLSFTGVSAPTKGLCDKLGFIFPPLFPYWFVDHWIDDLVRMIGRIAYADVRTDQSRAGKTQEMREPGWWATFFDACYLVRRRQARTLIDDPEFCGADWHKELLRTHHPLIEQRSRGVNEGVRQQDKQLSGWSGLSVADERYQRVKARAVAMVPFLLDDVEKDWPGFAQFLRERLTPPKTVPNMLGRAYG